MDAVESVKLLVRSGSDVRRVLGDLGSPECAAAVASGLADRRLQLLQLAQQELGILQEITSVAVADAKAASLCEALAGAGVKVPAPLLVQPGYVHIYHESLDINCFPAFYEHGFINVTSPDVEGLTPVMRYRPFYLNYPRYLYMKSNTMPWLQANTMPWLEAKGLLDATPGPSWRTNLNATATGWHYVAAQAAIGSNYWRGLSPNSGWELLEQLSKTNSTDTCSCWCTPENQGCSPLAMAWRILGSRRGMMDQTLARHVYLHHGEVTARLESDPSPAHFPSLIRLLTFEALEMTHTCCSYEHGESHPQKWAIVSLSKDEQQQIRSLQEERQNAVALETLMKEFNGQLAAWDSSSKNFDTFIWGPWRRRISELFAIDADTLKEMQSTADEVQTYVVPERLQRILGDDFDIIRYTTGGHEKKGKRHDKEGDCAETRHGVEDDDAIDNEDVEEIDGVFTCRYCDDPYYDSDD
jgi:hypothetical protein